jgi:ABC-type nitrate/sulfonate/bicarbonate transport system substrate-binding protein
MKKNAAQRREKFFASFGKEPLRCGFQKRRFLLALICTLGAVDAHAADDVTLGKAVPNSFAFGTVDVGIDAHIWETEGIAMHVTAFRGDAVLQQALTTGSIDFGLGSGPAMGFHVKGAPATAVAVVAGAPYNMSLCVPAKGVVQTPAELKGRIIGFSTVGSLTDWLLRELSRQEGWGASGIHGVPLGTSQSSIAAIRAGQANGVVTELATCLQLHQEGSFNVLVNFGDRVKQMYTHVLFARNDLIDTKPDLVRRTLRGWFKTIAFMRGHKAETISTIEKITDLTPDVAGETYDREMGMMSTDGAFDQPTLQVIATSLQELNILPEVPPTSQLYDGRFVPVTLPKE